MKIWEELEEKIEIWEELEEEGENMRRTGRRRKKYEKNWKKKIDMRRTGRRRWKYEKNWKKKVEIWEELGEEEKI